MVMTTRGEMDESFLEKREGFKASEREEAHWTEYWFEGEMVHRSVDITLLDPPKIVLAGGDFNG